MIRQLLTAVFLVCCFSGAQASSVVVKDIRVWASPEGTRVVLDISSPVKHKVFSLKGPDRLVLDLEKASVDRKVLEKVSAQGDLLRGIRAAKRNKVDSRIVLDLSSSVKAKTFLIKPNSTYGHRLVVDLLDSVRKPEAVAAPVKAVNKNVEKDFIIVIDPGHGGEDPGAIGFRKTTEKEIVLAVAKKLKKSLSQLKGVKVYLTRDKDYFLPLRKRTEFARKKEADLFVSIHADGFKDRRVDGASVYALSQRGATSEAAKWLATRENNSDLVGGVSLDDKDDLLASVLLDLSQSATLDASLVLATSVLKEMGRVVELHKKSVEQAGFVVLKSPDIPSILIELGYISNLKEERSMKTAHYQERLAESISKGIMNFYIARGYDKRQYAMQDEIKRHQVRRGETLSAIAKRYQVSTRTLMQANKLDNDNILIGSVLLIPN